MSLLLPWLLASNPKSHCKDQCPGGYPLGFLLRALRFQLMLSHAQINILKSLGGKVLKIHTTYIPSPILNNKGHKCLNAHKSQTDHRNKSTRLSVSKWELMQSEEHKAFL